MNLESVTLSQEEETLLMFGKDDKHKSDKTQIKDCGA